MTFAYTSALGRFAADVGYNFVKLFQRVDACGIVELD